MDISQFVDEFPIIDHYILSESPASHYLVMRNLIYQFISFANKKDQREKCITALKEFVKIMPEYPTKSVRNFSRTVVDSLNESAPSVLATIVSTNPYLLPENLDLPLIQICKIIARITTCNDLSEITKDILRLRNSFNEQIAPSTEMPLKKLFRYLLKYNYQNEEIYSFIYYILQIYPAAILQSKIPYHPFLISELAPISLQDKNDFQGLPALNALYLYQFAYYTVLSLCRTHDIKFILILHRLSISGTNTVDAIIYSLIASFPKVQNFISTCDDKLKMPFTSVLACILTCTELPSLKKFIIIARDTLIQLYHDVLPNISSHMTKTAFEAIYMALTLNSQSPLAHVYSHWLGKPFNSLMMIHALPPLSPHLPALIASNTQHLIKTPLLLIKLVNKILFSGPSLAAQSALKELAKQMNPSLFAIFIVKRISTNDFIPAVHLLSKVPDIPDFAEIEVVKAYIKIISDSIYSESTHSLSHIYFFSNYIELMPNDELIKFTKKFAETKNTRILSRFLLFFTSSPSFAVFVPKNVELLHLLFAIMGRYKNTSDPSMIACICIAWHNLCISIDKSHLSSQPISTFLKEGVQILIKKWNTPELCDLITEALIDGIQKPETRNVIATHVSKSISDYVPYFVDALKQIDPGLTNSLFPKYSQKNSEIRQIIIGDPMKWDYSRWVQYVSNEIHIAKAV